jgi:hypothetical protein
MKVYANSSFKRNMAERAVKEVKIRLSIKLDLEGTENSLLAPFYKKC